MDVLKNSSTHLRGMLELSFPFPSPFLHNNLLSVYHELSGGIHAGETEASHALNR